MIPNICNIIYSDIKTIVDYQIGNNAVPVDKLYAIFWRVVAGAIIPVFLAGCVAVGLIVVGIFGIGMGLAGVIILAELIEAIVIPIIAIVGFTCTMAVIIGYETTVYIKNLEDIDTRYPNLGDNAYSNSLWADEITQNMIIRPILKPLLLSESFIKYL